MLSFAKSFPPAAQESGEHETQVMLVGVSMMLCQYSWREGTRLPFQHADAMKPLSSPNTRQQNQKNRRERGFSCVTNAWWKTQVALLIAMLFLKKRKKLGLLVGLVLNLIVFVFKYSPIQECMKNQPKSCPLNPEEEIFITTQERSL